MKNIDFFISCGPKQGMGHLSRSLVLARTFDKDVTIRFFLTDKTSLPRTKPFPSSAFNSSDWAPTGSHQPAHIAIADGIELTGGFLNALNSHYDHLVVIDDLADRAFQSDLIVNPNLYAHSSEYELAADNLCIGPEYALINPAFAAIRKIVPPTPKVLLTFGGGATGRMTLDVAHALAARTEAPMVAAVGSFDQYDPKTLPKNIDARQNADMPDLMRDCTHYIGSLGTSFLEAQAAGLICIVSPIVDNQLRVAAPAQKMGATVITPYDPEKMADAAAEILRSCERKRSHSLVDGIGARRVVERIRAIAEKNDA